jgi:hypothetical protein
MTGCWSVYPYSPDVTKTHRDEAGVSATEKHDDGS